MPVYLILALILLLVSFLLFRRLVQNSKSRYFKAFLAILAALLATPSFLFASNYLIDRPSQPWFYYFHSIPGIEASSALIGAIIGVVFGSTRVRRSLSRKMLLAILVAVGVLLSAVPFAKGMVCPLNYSLLRDSWSNGVCLQTSCSTCVPASCATVISLLGGHVTEKELAVDANTSTRGTEIWYMMRGIRKHGYKLEVHTAKTFKDIPTPSVLGVKIGRAGHVVALMSKNNDGVEIGNPIGMRRRYSWGGFERHYHPQLVYFTITPLKFCR